MADNWYARLLRGVLHPGWEQIVRRRPTLDRLAYLEKTQWRSPDELRALQTAALRRLVTHAWEKVPFYRRRMELAGVGPDDLRTPEDLQRLPVLTREQARASFETRRSTAPPLPTIRKSTGGTTGQPLAFGYDPDSEYWRQAVRLRGYGWAGYRVGDRALHYWGAPPEPVGSARVRAKIWLDRALKRETYVDCGRRGEAELLAVVETIRRRRPQVIVAYTQAAADLARFVVERGLRDWDTIPVVCGAEALFDADRRALEAAFGPAVFETYGCREVMLIGSECEAHDGLHLCVEHLVVEVLAEGGRPAGPGEIGDVVITDLHNLGMPFIRYANGDRAVVGPDAPCACGRGLPRLQRVEGRVAETLRDGAGNAVGGLVFNVLFTPLADVVRQFQAVQHPDGSVTLKLVAAPALDAGTQARVRRSVEKALPGVAVRLALVDEIPPGRNGKRQVVIVER